MHKLFFAMLIFLSVVVLPVSGMTVKILLLDNTWLETNLLSADSEGNLTVQRDNEQCVLRRHDFKFVQLLCSVPEMRQAEILFQHQHEQEASKLLTLAATKYNFPPAELQINILQAQIKLAEACPRDAVSFLEPWLKKEMGMAQREFIFYAHAFLLLGNAHEKLQHYVDAEKAYCRSFELAVPEYSALANLARGKMFLKQKKSRKALNCFLENISVFSAGTPGRELSLKEMVVFYKQNNNKNLKQYVEMLKNDLSLNKIK